MRGLCEMDSLFYQDKNTTLLKELEGEKQLLIFAPWFSLATEWQRRSRQLDVLRLSLWRGEKWAAFTHATCEPCLPVRTCGGITFMHYITAV